MERITQNRDDRLDDFPQSVRRHDVADSSKRLRNGIADDRVGASAGHRKCGQQGDETRMQSRDELFGDDREHGQAVEEVLAFTVVDLEDSVGLCRRACNTAARAWSETRPVLERVWTSTNAYLDRMSRAKGLPYSSIASAPWSAGPRRTASREQPTLAEHRDKPVSSPRPIRRQPLEKVCSTFPLRLARDPWRDSGFRPRSTWPMRKAV
jgi:hypothetical protein